MNDRDAVRKADDRRRVVPEARGTASTERMGREQQRRATAYGRARDRL